MQTRDALDQKWVYDRVSLEIYNPHLNTCLGVQRLSEINHASCPSPSPAPFVVSAACGQWVVTIDENEVVVPAGVLPQVLQGLTKLEHCLRFQRWTYDPVTQVLSNPFGATVLDIQFGGDPPPNSTPGRPVWDLGSATTRRPKRWYADPAPIILFAFFEVLGCRLRLFGLRVTCLVQVRSDGNEAATGPKKDLIVGRQPPRTGTVKLAERKAWWVASLVRGKRAG